jgi:hypothetical protein
MWLKVPPTARYAGLTGSPDESGAQRREQGLAGGMGGVPPLGYRGRDRKLVIVDSEAELARSIFRRYAELGSVRLSRGRKTEC